MSRRTFFLVVVACIALVIAVSPVAAARINRILLNDTANPTATPQPALVRIVFFYAADCLHCQAVQSDLLEPLQAMYGEKLEVERLEIGTPANYELLIQAETLHAVQPEQRGIPTILVGDHILIGETEIRGKLLELIQSGMNGQGSVLPSIANLDAAPTKQQVTLGQPAVGGSTSTQSVGCTTETTQTAACEVAAPIYAAYFYQVGCQQCSRVKSDLDYIRSRYPQLLVEEFNIYDHVALAQWLGEQADRESVLAPAVFVGNQALVGAHEITPENLAALLDRYTVVGAARVWQAFNAQNDSSGLVEQFRSYGIITVFMAGLVDGLNPCAFATLIFFVSYLTISGRKGREILFIGAAFTLGVFLTYLLVGLGVYKLLDALGGLLTEIGRWVYLLTALFCAGLAILSFLDFLKARRGQIGDMALNLPESLRGRINYVIRQGRSARFFAVGAFVTGMVISLLELACTGQIYLPTIIYVASMPELRVQAIGYLLLYNLLFILPLVVVFILAYYGATSADLTRFLKKRAAAVKLGMMVVFASLSAWLGLALLQ